MARTTGPLFSISAKGTIANALTYQTSKGINTTRQRPVPANPKTFQQILARAGIKITNKIWRTLTSNQKAYWKPLGELTQITGFNAFTAQNINRRTQNLFTIGGDPDDFPSGIGAQTEVLVTTGPGTIEMDVEWFIEPEDQVWLYYGLSTYGDGQSGNAANQVDADVPTITPTWSKTLEGIPPGEYELTTQLVNLKGDVIDTYNFPDTVEVF